MMGNESKERMCGGSKFRHYDDVMQKYLKNIAEILTVLYPAEGGNGFTERNLSVNFASAYKSIAEAERERCAVWYEFPFDGSRHYDAVIINDTANEILAIEAKRIKSNRKIDGIRDDIERIRQLPDKLGARLYREGDYKIYGVILADVWSTKHASLKNDAKKEFEENRFLIDCFAGKEPDYRCMSFDGEQCMAISEDAIRSSYHLLVMTWKERDLPYKRATAAE